MYMLDAVNARGKNNVKDTDYVGTKIKNKVLCKIVFYLIIYLQV